MDLEEMEKRLRTLEDIEEIKNIQVRYVNYLTTADWDKLVECFTKDAFVDLTNGSARGTAEIEKFFKGKISVTHIGKEGNFVLHPLVTVDGDTARGNWLLYTFFSMPHKIQVGDGEEDAPDWMQGYYDMEYVKEDGVWKISLLKWRRRNRSPRRPSE